MENEVLVNFISKIFLPNPLWLNIYIFASINRFIYVKYQGVRY